MSICVKEDSLSYRALKQIRFDPLLSHFDLQDLVKQVILAVRTNEASLSTSLSLSTAVLKKTCKQLAADFSLSDGVREFARSISTLSSLPLRLAAPRLLS